MDFDAWSCDLARAQWQREYWAKRDAEIAEREAREQADRLAQFVDPNSPVVRQARAEAEAAGAKPKKKPKPERGLRDEEERENLVRFYRAKGYL
jgi:hypothetical protein